MFAHQQQYNYGYQQQPPPQQVFIYSGHGGGYGGGAMQQPPLPQQDRRLEIPNYQNFLAVTPLPRLQAPAPVAQLRARANIFKKKVVKQFPTNR